jgi:hypothetical protein
MSNCRYWIWIRLNLKKKFEHEYEYKKNIKIIKWLKIKLYGFRIKFI